MDVQIIDVDYILLNGNPVIRIFGKNESGETVCLFYNKYLPYFYASGIDDELEKDPDIVKIEKVKRKLVQEGEKELYKITIHNPAKTPEFREKLKSKGYKVYEADILFKYRFMSDFGLTGFGWIAVSDGKRVPTNAVIADKKLEISEFKPTEKDEDVELKYMAFDIECVSGGESKIPDPSRDPIILISVVFSRPYKGKRSIVLGTRSYKNVMSFETEKEMLEEFIRIIDGFDPDIITGFNINNFDIPYVLERLRQNGVKPYLGRCKQKSMMSRKIGIRYRNYIPGRIIVDSYEIVKKDFSLQRYGLDYVAETLLGQRKEDVKHSEIEKLWKGTIKEYERLVSYCLKDSELALNLILELKLLDKYIALSKVSGTLLQDTLGGGEATRIENYLLREFNKKGYIFPSRPERISTRELIGGAVLEPKRGLHNSVAVLDFKSMYPSIIRSFNICPTTLTTDKENSIETPSGARFLKREVKEGIIPKILEHLVETRQKVKKEMKQTRKKDKIHVLDAKQWALKIMANAFYGYFGYVNSRLFNLDIANAITSSGRKIIRDTKEAIENKFGYEVVYGDTDSVFVKIPSDDLEEISKKAEEIVNYANERLPKGIELEFEKIFKRFLPLTKKRYAAWKFVRGPDGWEESIETKGIETVRRDWCPLIGDTLMDILTIILKENDKKKAVKHFKEVIDKLLRNEIPIKKLVVTKTMTKSPKSYAGVQPHIELVKKIQKRSPGEVPGVGDRIGYVIVKGTQMLSKRAEDPIYVMEHGLQIDSHYYIENQLLPPLERIFSAMGISKSELLGNGKQMGLLDILKNNKNKNLEPEIRETGTTEEFNGFVCKKCNNFYRRPPLTGYCECGGELVFSSPKGLFKFLVSDSKKQ
jgi:DNA polymerase I